MKKTVKFFITLIILIIGISNVNGKECSSIINTDECLKAGCKVSRNPITGGVACSKKDDSSKDETITISSDYTCNYSNSKKKLSFYIDANGFVKLSDVNVCNWTNFNSCSLKNNDFNGFYGYEYVKINKKCPQYVIADIHTNESYFADKFELASKLSSTIGSDIYNLDSSSSSKYLNISNKYYDQIQICGSLENIPSALPQFIKNIINIIKIIVPIALVILGMIDFGKAMAAGDEKVIKESRKKFVTRIIAGIVVFTIISLTQLIFSIIGNSDMSSTVACINCFVNGTCTSNPELPIITNPVDPMTICKTQATAYCKISCIDSLTYNPETGTGIEDDGSGAINIEINKCVVRCENEKYAICESK